MSQELKTLKEQVEYCLQENDFTRDSDIALTIVVWQKFYNVGDEIKVKHLFNLPSQDTIKRIRAKFQNVDKKYLPTSLQVALTRGWLEEEWRAFLGYTVGCDKTDDHGQILLGTGD